MPLPPGDHRKLPPFTDTDAVLALFDDEEWREWSTAWPRFDDDRVPTLAEAVRLAKEEGNFAALDRLVEAQNERRKRGRPPGRPMSKADRLARWPIHRAASMVAMAKLILSDLYPDQLPHQIRDRALLVVEYFWDTPGITVQKLSNYLGRPRRNPRLIANDWTNKPRKKKPPLV